MATKNKSYQRKIKTREELIEAIGPRPRKKKVIMCHGTFDLVHPGHIRHLMYAKSKADILVASLTSDPHIKKADYRPFVPQDLRAMNLAALEMVDYVIVDGNETPLENLALIQPDYFAKGYEYGKEGLHPKTQEEVNVLESYGGEVIFTPGDVVYSSSFVIENNPPNLTAEKLQILMKGEGVTFEDLKNTIQNLQGIKVHVVGDTIVDTYTYCTLIGGMTKTPTFSLKYNNHHDYVGGAGIVAKHIRKAGADVTFTTVLGDDELKNFVVKDLKEYGVNCEPVIDSTRPTTQKNVFTASNYRMLKVDKLDNRSISDKILKKFTDAISHTKADVIVFSDFRHGIFNTRTIPSLIQSIPEKVLKVADSQVASRWGNILEFQDFDLITPNEREARFALGDQDSTIRPLAMELFIKAKCKLLILKLGERGSITYRAPNPQTRSFFILDSFTNHVVDAVGSGDAFLF
ncbi:MAG: PfkB family carbohydrate kinase [Verrucomicrobiota bacterium]